MFKKQDVNGKEENSIYTFFKSRCPSPDGFIDELNNIRWSPVRNDDITWNFEKILVDHKGHPVRRYKPAVEPSQIDSDIAQLIDACMVDMKADTPRGIYRP